MKNNKLLTASASLAKKSLKSKGYTLIELLLVVGLITILSALIYSGYSKREAAIKSESQVKWVRGIDDGVQSLAQPSDDTTLAAALTNANIIAANVVPRESVVGTTIQNMFGGPTTFGAKNIAGRTGYTVRLDDIPSNACVNLATQIGYAAEEVSVNGTPVKVAGSTDDIDPAFVASLCGTQLNSVEIGKTIRRLTDTVNVESTGYPGLNDSYLVSDVHNSKQNNLGTCPAVPSYVPATENAVAPSRTGTGCTCPEGTTWSGVACFPLSAKYRTHGVTIGSTIPAGDTANMRNFAIGMTTGANGNFDTDQQHYKMRELYDPAFDPVVDQKANPVTFLPTPNPDVEGGIDTSTNGTGINTPVGSSRLSCINGFVSNGGRNPDGTPGVEACVPATFTYVNGGVDTTVPIVSSWDNAKLRTCVLGTNNGDRCMMPNTEGAYAQNTARTVRTTPSDGEGRDPTVNPTVWKNPVRLPLVETQFCTNGKVLNTTTNTCECTAGTTFNSAGNYCACPTGTKYVMTPGLDATTIPLGGTGSCVAITPP